MNIDTPAPANACYWNKDDSDPWWATQCGKCYESSDRFFFPHGEDFDFCPYCGKPIEVKNER